MKHILRTVCLILALMIFSAFAFGCSEEKDDGMTAKDGYSESAASVKFFSEDDVTYIEVWWAIKNTSDEDIFLQWSAVDLENADGEVIDNIDFVGGYPEVLQPGETGYYYEATEYEGTETEVKAVPHSEIEKSYVDCIRYNVSDISITDGDGSGMTVTGNVENTSSETGENIRITAFVFDSGKNLICSDYTYPEGNIPAGEKISFSIVFDKVDITAADAASYIVYAHPLQYNEVPET